MLKTVFMLLIVTSAFAGQTINQETGKTDKCMTVKTVDGTVKNASCMDLKVPNGSLTNNGDGSFLLAGGGWTDTDGALYVTTSTDNVGIGSSAPVAALDIKTNSKPLLGIRRSDAFDFVKYKRVGTGVWTDITAEAAISRGSVSGDVLDVINDTFVIGKTSKFTNVYIDVGTARSLTGTFVWEYSLGSDTWAELTVTDGTNALYTDGALSFTAPADWATDSQDSSAQMYFIRLRPTAGTFTTEPTVYLVIPSTNDNVFEVRGSSGDTTSNGLWVDANGQVNLTNVNTITLLNTLTATISGRISYSNSASLGLAYGVSEAAGTATAIIQSSNSPSLSLAGEAWNGSASRTNTMEIYLNPDAEYVTNGRMAFKNSVVDDISETSELMSLDTNGRLSVLGRAQSSQDMFDRVFQYINPTYTDITSIVSSFGQTTGDVLNVVGDYVYIGKEDQFDEMYFDFSTIMSSGTSRTWEYWDGDSWATLTVTDATAEWQNDGSVTFTPPVDWAIGTVNSVAGLYWVRVGTASGTFTVEPTLRVLLPNTTAITKEILSNNEFDGTTGWTAAGDIAYTTGDYTFTYSTGSGTLTQSSADFNSALKPNTWYRFRYIAGASGGTNTVAWIGEEVATGKTYFNPSTTEVDVFFKTNSNPGNFVIYVTASASGLRLDSVFLKELEGGVIHATGDIRSDGVLRGNGTEGIKIDSNGNVGVGTIEPRTVLDVDGDIYTDSVIYAQSFFGDGSNLTGIVAEGGTSQWTTSGDDIYYADGNVAIGTTGSSSDLHVEGGSPAVASINSVNSGIGGCDGETDLLLHLTADASDSNCNGTGAKTVTNTDVTFTDSVGNFNGSSSKLSVNDNAAWQFGTAGTAEGWFKPSSGTQYKVLWSQTTNSTNRSLAFWDGSNPPKVTWWVDSGSRVVNLTTTQTCTLNTECHIAFVKNGTTYTIYINGVGASTTWAGTYPDYTGPLVIGFETNNYYFAGTIREFRKKNVAEYTSDFTPPTPPFGVSNGEPTLSLQSNGTQTAAIYTDGADYNELRLAVGSTDIASFSTDGTVGIGTASQMTVLSGGCVGIGDASPDHTLEIVGTFAASASAAGDGDRFVVTSTGNVGIGTTTPVQPLEIYGDGKYQRHTFPTNTSYAGITFYEASTAKGYIQQIGSNFATAARRNALEISSPTSGSIVFQKDGGNVGIGTSTPTQLLSVAGSCIQMKSPDGSLSNCCVDNSDAFACTGI